MEREYRDYLVDLLRGDSAPHACGCVGKQNGEPFCPCEMRSRGVHKRGDDWVIPERIIKE